jgi:hypothetical protein
MSNPLAIAAVTATLRNLLQAGLATDPDLNDITVTMQPLDRARVNGNAANQMNVFLYHVLPSGAWRNADMPGRVRSGETGTFPLGLNLYYLLTAFGRENDNTQPFSHQVMGRAMSIMNDHPLLGSTEIQNALPNNDLWNQVERVRFTLQPFSVEEIAKLWTGFQTQYRLSVAYEAAVVLIESTRTLVAPLPVLKRAKDDSGVVALANLIPPYPALSKINLLLPPALPAKTPTILAPLGQTTATLGCGVQLVGQHLSGDVVTVQFSPVRLPTPLAVPALAGGTDTQVTAVIPTDNPAGWPAGIYSVQVIVNTNIAPKQVDVRTTNGLLVAIAPAVTSKLPMTVKRPNKIKLTCASVVQPSQQVSLFLDMQEIPADALAAASNQLTFPSDAAAPGAHLIRLRIDGVDSQLIDHSQKPPVFDTSQTVTIT